MATPEGNTVTGKVMMMLKSADRYIAKGFLAASLMLPIAAVAATNNTVIAEFNGHGRPFILHLQGETTPPDNEYGQEDRLQAYAGAHTGNYVVFLSAGELHRIDQAALVHEIKAMYEPMDELSRKQEALGRQQQQLGRQQRAFSDQQRPLSDQQRMLGAEMENVSSSVGMSNLGAAQSHVGSSVGMSNLGAAQSHVGSIQSALGRQQSELGRIQSELGRQQSELGRQQGEIGNQVYARVQTMIDDCLEHHTCAEVEMKKP